MSSSGVRPRAFWLICSLATVGAACGAASAPETSHSAAATTLTTQVTIPTATPVPTPTPTPCSNQTVLATWTLARLAEQTIVVPVDEGDVAAIRSEVAQGAGGVILFGSSAPVNLATQLNALTAVAPGGLAPYVMTDEEGGAVQRMANLVGSVPSARQMGATMSASEIDALAQGLAKRMRVNGVTMDLAPVLDVDGGVGPNNNDADGTRSFSADESIASTDGRAFATGLAQGGITAVVKHFPGLGGATGNTDVVPASTVPWNELQHDGLQPFKDAIAMGVPAVMIANATVPGLTTLPASISAAVIQTVLRTQLGFAGLVLTDSLSANALSAIGYSVPAAAVAALKAGADMVLFNADASHVAQMTSATLNAITAAVSRGDLSHSELIDAVSHVLTAKNVDLCGA